MVYVLPPANYQAHYRWAVTGVLGANNMALEGFSFGFATTATLQQAPADWQSNSADAIAAAFADPGLKISAAAWLTQVKISLTNPVTGKVTNPPYVKAFSVQGGAGQYSKLPWQVALAVSLGVAADPRKAKGRFYLPVPLVDTTGTDGTFPTGIQDQVLASVKTMMDAVQTASGEKLVVASRTSGNHIVTSVRVGNKLDTIRSRRNKGVESYRSIAL